MILYFADRHFNILGTASTQLPGGLVVIDDVKAGDVESGVDVFECKVAYDKSTRETVEACLEVGNFILRKHEDEEELYTIVDAEIDRKKQTVYIYAEDAGLDLINEIVSEYEADQEYPIDHYVTKFAYDSGFSIGINEAEGLTRKLTFDKEETVTARLARVAAAFDNCEIAYRFIIEGLRCTGKVINIYKKRGQDLGVTLRLNKEIDNIIIKKTIANIATALRATGATPDDADNPITLRGYAYDDGDFYVDGDALKSREALKRWSRYINPDEPNQQEGHEGHIVRLFDYDTVDQEKLWLETLKELKRVRDAEVNYEAEILSLPQNVKIGDRVNIVDEVGKLFLSTRLLQLERSVVKDEHKAVLGEHLLKGSGISQKVLELAEQHAKTAKSAERALIIAGNAGEAAQEAQEKANQAAEDAGAAQEAANAATDAAAQATESAATAQQKAAEAEAAVDAVEESVAGIETAVANAQQAAQGAQAAAATAQDKANKANESAAQAVEDAAAAAGASALAQERAETAITKAEAAKSEADAAKAEADTAKATAEAAKQDAQKAEEEIAALGQNLETVTQTMEANYARITDLTEASARMQSQISQNAGLISSTVSMFSKIDETANEAQTQLARAQARAQAARDQADQAAQDADDAQTAADTAKAAADRAQAEADAAMEEAQEAQDILDQAQAELDAANAELDAVLSRAGATAEDIADARRAVEAAQAAANSAREDAENAAELAADAQQKADTAIRSAEEAQVSAENAAELAALALALANEAENAQAAIEEAEQAVQDAANAQQTADQARADAENAKTAAEDAAKEAADALAASEEADERAAQAAADLVAARQRLNETLADVNATEEEIAAAQAALDAAQAAADAALENATQAAAAAAQAQIDAATAQALADNAKAAAEEAQKAADDAQAAADAAQEAVDQLAVRVTKAETAIEQNAEQIILRATREEVAETLGGYYTKEETEALLEIESDSIKSVVRREAVLNTVIDGQCSQCVNVENALENSIDNVKIYGKTTQSATPTPEAPVALESVGSGGSVALAMAGVNLLNLDSCRFYNCTYSNGVLTSNISGHYYAAAISTTLSTLLLASKGKTFTFSIGSEIADRMLSIVIYGQRTSGQTYQEVNKYGRSVSITVADDFEQIGNVELRWNRNASASFSDTTTTCTEIQFEFGATATEYTPYNGLTISAAVTNDFSGIPMQDVCEKHNYTDESGQKWFTDEIDFARGLYIQRCFTVSFDGTEAWYLLNDTGLICLASNTYEPLAAFDTGTNAQDGGNCAYHICSHFQSMPRNSTRPAGSVTSYGSTNGNTLQFNDATYNGALEGWKAWLADQAAAGTPVTMLLGMKAPIETALEEPVSLPSNPAGSFSLSSNGIVYAKVSGAASGTAAQNAQEAAEGAQAAADNAANAAAFAMSQIQQLADMISTLVTDGNGASLMTQTAEGGWTFSMAAIQEALASGAINLEGLAEAIEAAKGDIESLAESLGLTLNYVKIGEWNGQPCIELGETDSDFKLRITNTEIQFSDGTVIPAYISNKKLMIEQTEIKGDLQFSPVGNRNYLKGTEDLSGANAYNSNGSWVETADGKKLTFAGNANMGVLVPLAFDGCIESGETITLSFDYRGNITSPGYIFFVQRTAPNVSNSLNSVKELVVSETEWQHYSATFSNADANVRTCYRIILFYSLEKYTAENWIEIKAKSLKLEKGDKATAWTAAPEDGNAEKHGTWIWKRRENGNFGLSWKGVDE